MLTLKILAAAAVLAVAIPAQAQMYKCVDVRGRTSFSYQPGAGCTLVGGGKPADPRAAQQGASPGPSGALPPGARTGPGTKGGPAPGAKSAVKPKAAVVPKTPAPKPPPESSAQRAGRCAAARQQLEWLSGPRGEGAPAREARLAQLQQALRGCPAL